MKWIPFFALWVTCFACQNCDVLGEIVHSSQSVMELPPSARDKTLLLHLDVNGVLIGVDSTHEGGAHDYMIYQLSKLIEDDWGEGTMRYFDYVNRRVREGAHREETTRLLRSKIEGREYAHLYDKVFEILLKESEKEAIFPAFDTLMAALEGLNYRILLRSFGHDATAVAAEIHQSYGIDFLKVRSTGTSWVLENGTEITDVAKMHELCKNHHLLVHDSYPHWSKNGRLSEAGKIFPISNDPSIVELFFDDNVIKGIDPRVSVVNPRRLDGCLVPYREEVNHHIIDVKTAQVIGDKNYFIKKIMKLI